MVSMLRCTALEGLKSLVLIRIGHTKKEFDLTKQSYVMTFYCCITSE